MITATTPVVSLRLLVTLVVSYIREVEEDYASTCEADFREALERVPSEGGKRLVCNQWLITCGQGRQ